jgi:hypothetical protein
LLSEGRFLTVAVLRIEIGGNYGVRCQLSGFSFQLLVSLMADG